ncbi:MAG: ATP-binding protein [Oscillospiraceae bacterium]|nr:ATP-binding protein [Oscillospiraceae bacterium]
MIGKLINNLTVKSRILVVMIIVISVSIVAVASIRVSQVRSQTDLLLAERLKGNANMTFGIFDTVKTYTMWILDTVAVHARHNFLDAQYDIQQQLGNLFKSINHEPNGAEFYDNIAVFDADFNLVAIARPNGNFPDILMFPEYFDEQMLGTWLSPVFENAITDRLQFMFTQPVMHGGDFLGMAAIICNTQMLEYFLRDFVQVYDSFINIADRSGTIFFSNRPEAYLGKHVDELSVVEAFDGAIPMNTVFAHNSALTGMDKIAYVTFDPHLNWTVVSFFDAHAVENIGRIIFASLLPTVSGIVLAAALIMLIVHLSLKPLQHLATRAKGVSEGNLERSFQASKNDEIGQVAASFMEIERILTILHNNFKNAERAMARGETEYNLEDSRLGGIYDEMLASINNIVRHMEQSKIQAEAASKAKSAFLSKMSHEIRTPMNAIIGMTELILRDNISPSVREQAVTINKSGDHLLTIINDILDLTKVESGKLKLINAEYLFHSVIQDVINIIKMRMSNPDVRFVAYMQSGIPNTFYGDSVRIRQTLLNILTNALKYTKKGHFSLEVTGEKKDDETYLLTMRIKDTGIGIKPEDMQELFDEFAQFDLEKNRGVEGTGLGLAITENLIRLMGGSISAKSEYGKGSEFTVTLPQKYEKDDYDTPCFKSKNILLYCRTALNTEFISRSLEDLAVTFQTVADDSDLQSKLSEGKWDFVFAEADLAYTAQHIIDAQELPTKNVMLSDSYDATYEARENMDFTLLVMPAYLISIVNVLSGRDSDYSANNQYMEQFIVPNAKILIVDDIETNLKVGAGLLKLYGVNADTCLSGKAAIEAVLVNDYDLVFMDHMMPEMDGVETVRVIRGYANSVDAKYADLPIVALTANAVVGARERLLENGFDDFLPKPIEVAKLNSILIKWITKEKRINISPTPTDKPEEEIEITLEDVDVARGIALSAGGIQSYFDTLEVFHRNGITKIEQLTDCLAQDDLALYTTHIHALKSACANVGANKLSEEAKILEAAGMKQDVEFITKHNLSFIDNLKRLLDNIDALISENTNTPGVGEGRDEDALKEHLTNLKAALEAFDVATIDEISALLQDFTQHQTMADQLKDILQSAFFGKYKQAIAQIDELLKT